MPDPNNPSGGGEGQTTPVPPTLPASTPQPYGTAAPVAAFKPEQGQSATGTAALQRIGDYQGQITAWQAYIDGTINPGIAQAQGQISRAQTNPEQVIPDKPATVKDQSGKDVPNPDQPLPADYADAAAKQMQGWLQQKTQYMNAIQDARTAIINESKLIESSAVPSTPAERAQEQATIGKTMAEADEARKRSAVDTATVDVASAQAAQIRAQTGGQAARDAADNGLKAAQTRYQQAQADLVPATQRATEATTNYTSAQAAAVAAGTPFIAPKAQAEIAATQAGTGLTTAQTGLTQGQTVTEAAKPALIQGQTAQAQAQAGQATAEAGLASAQTEQEQVKTQQLRQGADVTYFQQLRDAIKAGQITPEQATALWDKALLGGSQFDRQKEANAQGAAMQQLAAQNKIGVRPGQQFMTGGEPGGMLQQAFRQLGLSYTPQPLAPIGVPAWASQYGINLQANQGAPTGPAFDAQGNPLARVTPPPQGGPPQWSTQAASAMLQAQRAQQQTQGQLPIPTTMSPQEWEVRMKLSQQAQPATAVV